VYICIYIYLTQTDLNDKHLSALDAL